VWWIFKGGVNEICRCSFEIGGIAGRFMMDELVLEFFKSAVLS
jgi:hypothetical protein